MQSYVLETQTRVMQAFKISNNTLVLINVNQVMSILKISWHKWFFGIGISLLFVPSSVEQALLF